MNLQRALKPLSNGPSRTRFRLTVRTNDPFYSERSPNASRARLTKVNSPNRVNSWECRITSPNLSNGPPPARFGLTMRTNDPFASERFPVQWTDKRFRATFDPKSTPKLGSSPKEFQRSLNYLSNGSPRAQFGSTVCVRQSIFRKGLKNTAKWQVVHPAYRQVPIGSARGTPIGSPLGL